MAFADQTISEFLESVASVTVTPSGGAVAAIVGASGAALCEMMCVHTIGKDGYSAVETEMAEIRDGLRIRRDRLLALADEDSKAVDALQTAFRTPEDENRAEIIQDTSILATEVPLEIAEVCLDILEYATVVTENGNQNAIADAWTGAVLAHSALQVSVFTVQSNVKLIEDTTVIAEIEECVTEIDSSAEEMVQEVKTNVGNSS